MIISNQLNKPKWQRARLQPSSIKRYHSVKIPETFWIEAVPPRMSPSMKFVGYRTNIPNGISENGRLWCDTYNVELLPEFSFEDDPEMETRQ